MFVPICYNTYMEYDPIIFRDFIRDKFAAWRGKGRNTLQDYANYIGVSQQLMSNWYNGKFKRPPGPETSRLLISKYGNEVYSVLGLEVPGEPLLLMPEPFRSIAIELKNTLAEKHIDPESPEAGLLMDEIMKKYGYGLISTREEPLE